MDSNRRALKAEVLDTRSYCRALSLRTSFSVVAASSAMLRYESHLVLLCLLCSTWIRCPDVAAGRP